MTYDLDILEGNQSKKPERNAWNCESGRDVGVFNLSGEKGGKKKEKKERKR